MDTRQPVYTIDGRSFDHFIKEDPRYDENTMNIMEMRYTAMGLYYDKLDAHYNQFMKAAAKEAIDDHFEGMKA